MSFNIALGIAKVLHECKIKVKLYSTKDPNKFIFVSEMGDNILFEFCPNDRYSISIQSDIIQNMSFYDACQLLKELLTIHTWG
jgi:hypothetical protein